MRKILLSLAVAGLAFPGGVMVAFLATPLLGKLEGPLNMELAGHSGPADWVLLTSGVIASVLAGVVTYRLLSKTQERAWNRIP